MKGIAERRKISRSKLYLLTGSAGMIGATTMKILISGATGNVGSELANVLSRKGQKFRAMVRSPEKAGALASLPGTELVRGDFEDEGTLAAALDGVERVR